MAPNAVLNTQSLEDEQKLVKTLIEDLKQGMDFMTQNQEAFIVLGDTKHGKSTLTNYLCGIQLSCSKSRYGCKIETTEKSGLLIGNTRNPQTSKPEILKDKKNEKIIFWDSPGFYDIRGIRQEIMNGFYIQKVFEKTKKPKVIVVISYQALGQQRAGDILKIFQKMQKFFPDLEIVKRSTCIVFTKVPYFQQELTVKQLKEDLKCFMRQIKNIQDNTQSLLEHFANEGYLEIFYQPKNPGKIDPKNSQIIRKGLQKVQYANHNKIEVIISEEAKNTLAQVGSEFNLKIKKLFYNLSEEIIKSLKGILTKSPQTQKEGKKSINNLFQKIKQIRMSKNQEQLIEALKKLEVYQLEGINSILKSVFCYIEIMVFILRLNKSVNMQLFSWHSQLQLTQSFLRTLGQDPKAIHDQAQHSLQIRAHIIGFSSIKQIVSGKNISSLTVFSTCCLYLDDKIILPGAKVVMLSRNWVSSQQGGELILNGTKPEDYQKAQDAQLYKNDGTGQNGLDGRPGKSGNNGGTFFGKIIGKNQGKQIKLKLQLNGSKGGKGEDGGNGMNGKQLDIIEIDNNNLAKIKERNEQFLFERDFYLWEEASTGEKVTKVLKGIVTFNQQFKQTFYIQGQEGKKGGDAGKGGKGGKPGSTGIGKLFDRENNQLNIAINSTNQEEGQNGRPGQPGKGSKSSSNVRGLYKKQIIFSVARSASEIIKVQKQQQNCQPSQKQMKTQAKSQEMETIEFADFGPHEEQGEVLNNNREQNIQEQKNEKVESKKQKVVRYGYKFYHGFRSIVSGASGIGSGVLTGLKIIKNGVSTAVPIVVGVQLLLSAISTGLSSGWIKEPWLEDGKFGQNGIVPEVINYNGLEEPIDVQYFTNQQQDAIEKSFYKVGEYKYQHENRQVLGNLIELNF